MEKCDEKFCIIGSAVIYKEKLIDAMDYREYLDNIYALLMENKSSDNNQLDALIQYTKMNMRRMERWNKTIKLLPGVSDIFKKIKIKIEFLVITESWCGDAAHLLPVMQKIVELNDNFSLKTILRDENPDIMNQYLTNGNKSIPIVVALQIIKDQYVELFKWGPKPLPMMNKLNDFKEGKLNISKGLFLKETQLWYNQDQSKTIQNELAELMVDNVLK